MMTLGYVACGLNLSKTHDYSSHAELVLSPCPIGSHNKDQDSHWDCGNSEAKFDGREEIPDDDDELHRETKEKEEIELQQRNIDL